MIGLLFLGFKMFLEVNINFLVLWIVFLLIGIWIVIWLLLKLVLNGVYERGWSLIVLLWISIGL